MRMHLAILRSAAWLVPNEQRAEWLAEWNAELWYVQRSSELQTTSFCLGAFRDAFWLRRNRPPNAQTGLRLQSPAHCLGFLGLVATGCVLLALRWHPPDFAFQPIWQTILAMLLTPLMALPALFATTSLRLGEYPGEPFWLALGIFRGQDWVYVARRFFRGAGLWAVAGGGIGIAMVAAYVIAFRWVLSDQRRRCPECLRRLECPTRIGQPSHTLLEWYGTEFVCANGHGLLHVAESAYGFVSQAALGAFGPVLGGLVFVREAFDSKQFSRAGAPAPHRRNDNQNQRRRTGVSAPHWLPTVIALVTDSPI